MTWAAIMVTASATTGLTLPGMMLLPGCRAGSAISLRLQASIEHAPDELRHELTETKRLAGQAMEDYQAGRFGALFEQAIELVAFAENGLQ